MNKLKVALIIFFVFAPLANLSADNSGGGLILSPSTGSYNIGQKFNVDVLLYSSGRAINAVEANIAYPVEYLEIISVSKQNSIFMFWPEEPNFFNKDGILSFAGGLPSPGYMGKNGRILRIIFRAKKSGIVEINFKSGAILADDGAGTNTLSFFENSKYDLRAPIIEKKIAITPAPKIEIATGTAEKVVEIQEKYLIIEDKIGKIITILLMVISFLFGIFSMLMFGKFKKYIFKFCKKICAVCYNLIDDNRR